MSTFYPELEIRLEKSGTNEGILNILCLKQGKITQIEALFNHENTEGHSGKPRQETTFKNQSTESKKNSINLSFLLCLILREINGSFKEYSEAITHLKKIQIAIKNIHGILHILTGKTENQIIYDFIRKLDEDISPEQSSLLKSLPSLALTDQYNFNEYDLRNNLSLQIKNAGFEEIPSISRDVVFTLPKAECDNPLMWSILAHELAHAVRGWGRTEEIILPKTENDKFNNDNEKNFYINWMLEIYSDLFAIRLLGPSYFFSFVSMGFIIDPRPFNSNHPTYINRVGIMEQIIRENYKHWSIPSPKNRKAELSDSQITSKKDLIEYFFIQAQFFHELRIELSKGDYKHIFLHEINPVDEQYNIQADKKTIWQVLDSQRINTSTLVNGDSLLHILSTLEKGQPISSQTNEFDKRSFTKELNKLTPNGDIYKLLPQHDTPYTMSSILAGGWMLKIYSNYPYLWKLVKEDHSIINSKEKYKEVIQRRNSLLQNSINRAYMMQMYWKWKTNNHE